MSSKILVGSIFQQRRPGARGSCHSTLIHPHCPSPKRHLERSDEGANGNSTRYHREREREISRRYESRRGTRVEEVGSESLRSVSCFLVLSPSSIFARRNGACPDTFHADFTQKRWRIPFRAQPGHDDARRHAGFPDNGTTTAVRELSPSRTTTPIFLFPSHEKARGLSGSVA